MKNFRGIAAAMTALMASGAFAATTTTGRSTATNIPVVKKLMAKNATAADTAKKAAAKRRARSDMLPTTSSSATSSASASASMAGAAGASTMQAPASLKKTSALDKIKFGLVFEFAGPSITDPLSGYQPALSAEDEGANYGYSQGNNSQSLNTNIVLGYRISPNLTFVLNPVFQSVGDSADGQSKGSAFHLTEENSYMKLSVGKFVKSGKFTWNGDFRIYPGGLGDRTAGRTFYFRNGQNLMYSLTPKVTLAAYNSIRYYQRTDKYYADHPMAYNWRATVGPALEYQVSDKTGLSLSYNTEFRVHRGTGEVLDTPIDAAPFVEAGAVIDASKMVSINPYIDMYTNTPNIEAWQFGATVAFNIL